MTCRLASFLCFTVLCGVSSLAAAITIESPRGDEPVVLPFVVSGAAEPGAVLVLEVDGSVRRVFRANSEGEFAVAISTHASEVTVRSKLDPNRSATVVVETVEGDRAPPVQPLEKANPDPIEPPPPPETSAPPPSDRANVESSRSPGPDIPAGYEEQCHRRPVRSGFHCHVVPEGAEPSFKPFPPAMMAAQFFASIGAAVAIGFGAGYVTYLVTRPTSDEFSAATFGVLVGAVAAFPGGALGTWGVGELLGGDGSFLWTLGGMLLLGPLGSLAAYHLSADHVYPDEIRQYDKFGVRFSNAPPLGVPLVRLSF